MQSANESEISKPILAELSFFIASSFAIRFVHSDKRDNVYLFLRNAYSTSGRQVRPTSPK